MVGDRWLGRPSRTLAQAFDPRDNGIGFMRLVLAGLVIVGHAWPLGGYGAGPLAVWSHGAVGFGSLAVSGFFVLSGFLIARSFFGRSSALRYLWHRCLRILPGFWVCLLVTAAILGPGIWALSAAGSLSGYWTPPTDAPLTYVTDNWWLTIRQSGIAGLLSDVPFPNVINGSLWTLVIEFKAYLALAAVGLVAERLRRPAVVPLTALGLWLVHVAVVARPDLKAVATLFGGEEPLRLAVDFAFGAAAWTLRNRIPMDDRLGLVASLLLVAVFPVGQYLLVGSPILAYALLWVACRSPIRSFDRRADLSYGTYLYAFPIQQALVVAGVSRLGPIPFILAAFAFTLPLAGLSWRTVERQALRMKGWRPGRVIGGPERRRVASRATAGVSQATADPASTSRPTPIDARPRSADRG